MGTDISIFANHVIDFSGNNFEIIVENINTNTHIEYHDPGCRYDSFFGMDKKYRIEWRKYYYQYINLFGGSFAIYLPDQGDVAWEFTEKIWDNNLNLDIIVNGLSEKYGYNNIGIDDFPIDSDDFVDAPYYFIDKFEDIK
jgi:hypothetical protein